MWRALLALTTIAFALVMISSCSDDDCPACPESAVHLSGRVLAYFCGIGDINNNTGELRYSVLTGRPAYVTLTALNGRTHTLNTDDSSAFDLYLDRGVYAVSITADHVRPFEVGDLQISGDTAVDLKVVYNFFTEGHYLYCNFAYPTGDSIGEAAELSALNALNTAAGGVLYFGQIVRTSVIEAGSAIYIGYTAQVRSDLFNWEASDSLTTELTANSGSYPEGLSIDPGHYICMW